MHFLCNVSLPVKVPKFRVATALQRCKLFAAFGGGEGLSAHTK